MPLLLEHGFCVLNDLVGRFEVKIVCPIIFVFAILGGIVTTDLGARFVDAAAIIGLKMLAHRMHKQIPVIIIFEDSGFVVQQVPADVVIIGNGFRSLDNHRKITAAFSGTVLAENLALRQIFTMDLFVFQGYRHLKLSSKRADRGG